MLRCASGPPPCSWLLTLEAASLGGQDWPQFRGPTGQGHAEARGLPLQWSETQNIKWKVPVGGRGWSSPVVAQGRVWLTTSVEMPASGRERAGLSLRALAFDAETGKRVVDVEVFRLTRPASAQREEQLRLADAHPGRRPRLRPLRRRRHGGALHLRRDPVEGALQLRVAARRRRLAGALQRPADLQLRRQRGRGVRGGAGHAHRQGALEARPAPAGGPGLHHAARHQRQRARPADLGGRVSRRRLRPGHRPRDLARRLRRRASRTCRGRCSARGWCSSPPASSEPTLIAVRPDGEGDVTRSHVAWTLVARRAVHAVAAAGRRRAVHRQRHRRADASSTPSAAASTTRQRLGGNYSASPVLADGRIYFLSEEGVATVIAPGKTFNRLAVEPARRRRRWRRWRCRTGRSTSAATRTCIASARDYWPMP